MVGASASKLGNGMTPGAVAMDCSQDWHARKAPLKETWRGVTNFLSWRLLPDPRSVRTRS